MFSRLITSRYPLVVLITLGALALGGLRLEASENETPAEAPGRLEALRREIAEHDERYHRNASPIITDYEYDLLKRELRDLETAVGEPSDETVPDDRTGASPRWPHREAMLSLEKAYTAAELDAFHARVTRLLGREDVGYAVEPKFDGVAVSLVYIEGRLAAAVTRGNGVEGEDITRRMEGLDIAPQRLAIDPSDPAARGIPAFAEIRGELYVPWAAFRRVNVEREQAGESAYGHPRTLASATIQQRDPGDPTLHGMELVVYGLGAIEPAEARPRTQRALSDALRCWGLPVVSGARYATGRAELHSAVEALRQTLATASFPTDGVVIKVDDVQTQQRLGQSRSAPRWAIARKFEPPRAMTRLRAIVWQVGRTGVLSPIAEFDPVELGGSTVRRASLHNAEDLVRRDLRIGDWIVVEKAGEIIPAIVGIDSARRAEDSEPYRLPGSCPACGTALPRSDAQIEWRCVAEVCPERVRRQFEHYVTNVGVEGLGSTTLARLVERGRLQMLADLYRLQRHDLPAAQADRVLATIARSRRAEWTRVLRGLGLPGVGAAASTVLARHFSDLGELMAATEDELLAIPGLGEMTAKGLAKHWADPRQRKIVADLLEAGVGTGAEQELGRRE
jgi:DNA ligase (NAD+)